MKLRKFHLAWDVISGELSIYSVDNSGPLLGEALTSEVDRIVVFSKSHAMSRPCFLPNLFCAAIIKARIIAGLFFVDLLVLNSVFG